MNTTISLLVLSVLVVSVIGLANFNCPTPEDPSVVGACTPDCQQQHGAEYGTCGNIHGGDYNCYCHGPRIYTRSKLQCIKMTDGYRNLCTLDCLCNHGADGGYCAWDVGICNCVNWGLNANNTGCPTRSNDEFLRISYALANVSPTDINLKGQ